MSQIIQQAAVPALSRMGLSFLRDAEHDQLLVVPVPAPVRGSGHLLVFIEAKDAAEEALITAGPGVAPPARRAQVALTLCRLNTQYCGVTFAMDQEGDVTADVHVELKFVRDPEAAIALAFARLVHAIGKAFKEITETAHPKRVRLSPVERQVANLVNRLEE